VFIKSKRILSIHWFFQKKKKEQSDTKLNQKEGGSEQIKGSLTFYGLRLS